MTEITIISFVLNMAYLVVALFTLWSVLRIFDQLSGGSFGDAKKLITEEPLSCALYYGARFLGVCILGAAFVGG